eukprot:4778909-Pyramimonas_sp.AAC.1
MVFIVIKFPILVALTRGSTLTIGLWDEFDHVMTRSKYDVDIETGIPETMINNYAPSDEKTIQRQTCYNY